jgi:hypothetical protein
MWHLHPIKAIGENVLLLNRLAMLLIEKCLHVYTKFADPQYKYVLKRRKE